MKFIRKIMVYLFVLLILFAGVVFAFLQLPKFGKTPSGKRLEIIKKSPNYRDGAFKNLHETPNITQPFSVFFKDFFLTPKKRNKPVDEIPSIKTDLLRLDPQKDVLVWFGHSSYFFQVDGKKILVDPVLSGSASPLAFTTKAFRGTDGYKAEDIPEIDYLFISHDHWDHLDYETIIKLKSKIKKVICALGTGEHFEYWGFDPSKIIEKDWNETIPLEEGFTAYTAPARHFSGRGLLRNKALWTSWILQTPSMKIYIGGDSGYDTHFAEIGQKFGPFDLAILENGQYDKSWKYIHMMPAEGLQAAKELQAKRLFPVHSGKFAISNHDWDTPLKTITEENKKFNIPLVTPIIGEEVRLKDSSQTFTQWWKGLN